MVPPCPYCIRRSGATRCQEEGRQNAFGDRNDATRRRDAYRHQVSKLVPVLDILLDVDRQWGPEHGVQEELSVDIGFVGGGRLERILVGGGLWSATAGSRSARCHESLREGAWGPWLAVCSTGRRIWETCSHAAAPPPFCWRRTRTLLRLQLYIFSLFSSLWAQVELARISVPPGGFLNAQLDIPLPFFSSTRRSRLTYRKSLSSLRPRYMSTRTLGRSGCGRRRDFQALPPVFSLRLNIRSRTRACNLGKPASEARPDATSLGEYAIISQDRFEQIHLGPLLVHHCKSSSTALFEQFSFQVATRRTASTRPSFASIWTHREDYADGGRQAPLLR